MKNSNQERDIEVSPAMLDKTGSPEFSHPIPVVRLLIPDLTGRVLILRRKSSVHSSGSWCLPGGKVDYGKTVEETLIGELREETSLECEQSKFLFWQDSLPNANTTMHCINFYFECRVSGTLTLNEESSEFAWIGPEDMPQYQVVFRNDIAILRYWKEREEQKQRSTLIEE